MQPQKSPYTRDNPIPQPAPAQPPPADEQVKTELVTNIPVQTQGAPPAPTAEQPADNDQELDHVLTEVNHEVAQGIPAPPDKKAAKATKKAKTKPNYHLVPIILAIVVAVALAAVAFETFKTKGS